MGFLKSIRALFDSTSEPGTDPNLNELQIILGYHFTNLDLLRKSLTHRSACHEAGYDLESNERLEFLGDSVLGLAIAEQLYRDHPELREGELTKTKALLVNETTLTAIGKKIGLNRFILLSNDEDRSGGRQRSSIVSDAMESVIGAVFLDSGIAAARDLIFRLIYTNKSEIIADKSQHNSKGELLEWAQARGDGMPAYNVISEDGPDHEKIFKVDVLIGGNQLGSGVGNSKKEAEQKAAASALSYLAANPPEQS